MNMTAEIVILVVFFFWLSVLSFLFFRFYTYYVRLAKGSKKENIIHLISDIVEKEEKNKEAIENLTQICEQLSKDGSLHIQKIGLLRFNPFHDTGGDQSFILALLNNKDTGVVISSLHTRTGTRWYAKAVDSGKGVEYELSSEEQKAIRSASSHKA